MSSHDRDELQAWLRSQATPGLLSSLVFATDEASLKRFGRRVSKVPLSGEQLELLQQLAIAICCAVHSEHDDDWKAIARAANAVRNIFPASDAGNTLKPSSSGVRSKPNKDMAVPAADEPASPPTFPSPFAMKLPRLSPSEEEAIRAILHRTPESAQPPTNTAPNNTRPAHPAETKSVPVPFDPKAPVETEAIDLAAVATIMANSPTATPFATSHYGSQSAASVPSPQPSSYAPHPQAGATEGIDEAAIQAAIAGSYPLPSASLDRLPLSLDQYGALVARSEATRDVARLSALYAEYGVQDTAHRSRIDEVYCAVFEQHPELRSAFDNVVAQWRAYLRRG